MKPNFMIVALLALSVSTPAWAAHSHGPGHLCSRFLTDRDAVGDESESHPHAPDKPGDIRITNSGQDLDMQPQLREAAKIIYHDIAPKLGLTIPPMHIRHLNASDMAALSSNAGHPAPHFHDGANIVSGARRAAGIYEFVVPGQPAHHQFVRDTNNFHETVIVYAHVAGHYDFAEHTVYFKAREADQIRYSYELAEMMTRLYTTQDKAAVSEFYHRLLTLSGMQDMGRGSFDKPETFEPKPLERGPKDSKEGHDLLSRDPQLEYASPEHPTRPSESALQAFVKNLPPSSEPWKFEMAALFEKLNRAAPAYVQTKIMNEGWATVMEYILLAHSPWNSSHDAIEFGKLNAGVNVPGLSNPYWLGSQCWLRIRERFFERPEIAKLTPIEQDRAFIAEAHKIIQQYNDYTFIRMALDAKWVDKLNLHLKKTIEKNEWQGTQTVEAATRDPQRIVNWISQRIANHDLHFPKVEIVSFNDREDGRVLLRHRSVLGIPLKRDSVSKALYVLARLMERPVTLDTVGSWLWAGNPKQGANQWDPWQFLAQHSATLNSVAGKVKLPAGWSATDVAGIAMTKQGWDQLGKAGLIPQAQAIMSELNALSVAAGGPPNRWAIDPNTGNWFWMPDPPPPNFNDYLKPYPVRITVFPKGNVVVETDGPAPVPNGQMQIPWNMTREGMQVELQKHVDLFRQDASLSYLEARAKADLDRFDLAAAMESQTPMAGLVANLMNHAPTAAQAVWEYKNLAKMRMEQTLRLAVKGKWPIQFVGGNKRIRIRVLPETPEFELDHSIMELRREMLEPTPTDERFSLAEPLKGGFASLMGFGRGEPAAMKVREKNSKEEQLPDEDLDLGEGPQQPGDRWLEPLPPKGKGGGEGGEGEPGEPGEGAGDGSGGDPAYVEIPIELYGKMLAEEIQLRNLRRTKGENNVTDEIRVGGEHKPDGMVLWDRTAQEAIGLGMAVARKQGKDPRRMAPQELLKLGMKYLTPSEHVVAAYDKEPMPDFDAVIVYIADTSGSMGEAHRKAQREMVANQRALLKAVYPRLKEVFIIYDTEAREVSEKEFFTRQMGGGTNAESGIGLAEKILEERFPRSKYNRFAQIFSDGDDFSSGGSLRKGEQLAEKVEYLMYGHVEPFGNHTDPAVRAQLSAEFQRLAQSRPEQVGFAIITKASESIREAIKIYFGKR